MHAIRSLALAVLVLAVPAAAQQAPQGLAPSFSDGAKPQPPSAGGTPAAIPFGLPYGAPIIRDLAKRVGEAAEAEADKRGWPMNIAVVDTHGDLVHFARMDGAQLASVGVSQRKARTAARWRRETRVFFEGYAKGSAFYGTLDPELAASPGGLPLVVDGKIIGAIGCSGGTGDQDSVICQAGVEALR